MNDFQQPVLPYRPLEKDLNAPGYEQYVNRGVNPAGIIPQRITDGTAKFGPVTITYQADAGAGNQNVTEPLDTDSLPLGFVWYLGARDSDGVVVDTGAGIINRGETYATLTTEIYSAVAGCTWTSTSLIIYVKSSNTGYAKDITAYFYYCYFYDDLSVKNLGL